MHFLRGNNRMKIWWYSCLFIYRFSVLPVLGVWFHDWGNPCSLTSSIHSLISGQHSTKYKSPHLHLSQLILLTLILGIITLFNFSQKYLAFSMYFLFHNMIVNCTKLRFTSLGTTKILTITVYPSLQNKIHSSPIRIHYIYTKPSTTPRMQHDQYGHWSTKQCKAFFFLHFGHFQNTTVARTGLKHRLS